MMSGMLRLTWPMRPGIQLRRQLIQIRCWERLTSGWLALSADSDDHPTLAAGVPRHGIAQLKLVRGFRPCVTSLVSNYACDCVASVSLAL